MAALAGLPGLLRHGLDGEGPLSILSLHKDVCLDNKEVERAGPALVRLGSVVSPVGKVVAKSGRYQPAVNEKADEVVVKVKWPNNSVTSEQVVE